MKRNKKIMSIVAGAAIVSQLLPMGTVIANAQTINSTHIPHENKPDYYGYKNNIDLFANNGQDGLNIKFDTKDSELRVEAAYGSKDTMFDAENKDKVYLKLYLIDGTNEEDAVNGKGKVTKKVIIKGEDTIEQVVARLNGTKFKLGDGLRIRPTVNNKSLVKISGEVANTVRCFVPGIDKTILDKCTFLIRGDVLEYRQARC